METTTREPFYPALIYSIYRGKFEEETLGFLEYLFTYSDLATDPSDRVRSEYESCVSHFLDQFTLSILRHIALGNHEDIKKMFNELYGFLKKQAGNKNPLVPTNRKQLLIRQVEVLLQTMGAVLRDPEATVNQVAAIGTDDSTRRRKLFEKIKADGKMTRRAIIKDADPKTLWNDLKILMKAGYIGSYRSRYNKLPDFVFVPTFSEYIFKYVSKKRLSYNKSHS